MCFPGGLQAATATKSRQNPQGQLSETVGACLHVGECDDDLLLGCSPTAGIECMLGSAMYFMSTGMSHSHTRMLLSSEVVTIRRPSSTNVIELTAPKCRS